MGAAQLLIPELEEVIQHGSRQKRVETLQRITSLFLNGAASYSDEQLDLFDAVFGRLIKRSNPRRAPNCPISSRRYAMRR